MTRTFLFLIIFFLIQLKSIKSYKYLLYNPISGRSHVLFMGKLGEALIEANHTVINYQPIYTNEFNDTGTKRAKTMKRQLTFPIRRQMSSLQSHAWETPSYSRFFKSIKTSIEFARDLADYCEDQLKDAEMIQMLRDENFELIILEHYDPCGLGLAEVVGIRKHVVVHSLALSLTSTSLLGLPGSSASFVPDLTVSATPEMTFKERSRNVFYFLFYKMIIDWFVFPLNEEVIQKYVNTTFSFRERFGEAEFVFVNLLEWIDYPRPINSKVIYIGGIGNSNPKPLNEKYQKIFDKSSGVVYMSFGSVAPSYKMPNQTKQAFLEAFSAFPDVTFLWKYERPEDEIAKGYSNVITDIWVPQFDILSHPKTLAFISHAGK